MQAEFTDPKHLLFAIAILLGVIIAMAAGKGLGSLITFLLRRITGEVTVNVNSEDRKAMSSDRKHMADDRLAMSVDRTVMAGHACLIPENCPKHGEETARSIENKTDIAELKADAEKDRNLFWRELRAIRKGVSCITNGLLAKQIISPHDLPKED